MLEAFRTIYSVSETDKTDEVGLVYGLTDSVSEDEMIVVKLKYYSSFICSNTTGRDRQKVQFIDNAKSYCLTMEFIKMQRVL